MLATRLVSVVPRDMSHDFLTRLYLRQYAFLTRRYPHQPPSAIFHFAAIGVSSLLSLAALAIVALGCWTASHVLGRLIVPWAGPNWLIFSGSLGLGFLPGIFVDKKMAVLRPVDQGLVAFYS